MCVKLADELPELELHLATTDSRLVHIVHASARYQRAVSI